MRNQMKKWLLSALLVSGLVVGTGCTTDTSNKSTSVSSTEKISKTSSESSTNQQKVEQAKKDAEEKAKQEQLDKKNQEETSQKLKDQASDLAKLDYEGSQTIDVNQGNPNFTKEDLSMKNGAWEAYGDLDSLNRATSANAMLNQSLMPTGKRESISSVTPTGWKNKKINGGYLFNRSHLIGWALAGENANWKNLITGTRQLNSPEMLRHEMDVKYYLEKSPNNYVRYRVTPIFRGDELLARGVQMEAQSIGSDEIKFNVYIFNVQDGVSLNYADGSSSIADGEVKQETAQANQSNKTTNNQNTGNNEESSQVYVTPTGKKYHTHAHGRGDFKLSTLQEAKNSGLEPCKVCYK